jgi:hypothetical protein
MASQASVQTQAKSIVLIETNGTIKTLKTKDVSEETLYKKCGFRVSDDFTCRHTWQVKLKGDPVPFIVSLWAKKTGKANFENKYDFPPPVDKELYFGTCALVRTAPLAGSKTGKETNVFLDLTKETWLKIYEQLFGGFEDLGDEDEYSEDELANVDPALLTSHGYLKDDFVVSDKDSGGNSPVIANAIGPDAIDTDVSKVDAIDSDASSDVEVVVKKKKSKPVKKVSGGGKKTKKPILVKEEEIEEDNEDTSELEEEVYTFSDDDNL